MQFLGEFTMLKLTGIAIIGSVVYYLYMHYKSQLTADNLVSVFKGLVTKLETLAETKAKEAEGYVAQKAGLDKLQAEAEAEVAKAKAYAEKLKGMFS